MQALHEPDTASPRSPGRRRLMRALWFGGLGSVAVAVAAAVRTSGYDESLIDPAIRARLRVLSPWHYLVVSAVARRIVASDRTDDATVPTADDVGVATFVDGYLSGLGARPRRDFLRLVGLIEHVLPVASGKARRFTVLAPAPQDDVLRSLESSSIDELAAGFSAMKALVMTAYYGDPRTWRMLRYPGPLVGRPEGGFWSLP